MEKVKRPLLLGKVNFKVISIPTARFRRVFWSLVASPSRISYKSDPKSSRVTPSHNKSNLGDCSFTNQLKRKSKVMVSLPITHVENRGRRQDWAKCRLRSLVRQKTYGCTLKDMQRNCQKKLSWNLAGAQAPWNQLHEHEHVRWA